MVDKPFTHTSIDLPTDLHRALRVKLAKEGKSFAAWAREHAEADTKPKRRAS